MCNKYRNRVRLELLKGAFKRPKVSPQLELDLTFSEGTPNLQPRDEISITEVAPIVRAAEPGAADLVSRPWSWKGPRGAPVFNFRSEGRKFGLASRCLVVTDGFYEFRTPEGPKAKRKDRWLFTMRGDEELFFIAGYMREDAWAMLTVEPGPDIAPYHDRQVVVLRPEQAAAWLTGAPEGELLLPAPSGTLRAERMIPWGRWAAELRCQGYLDCLRRL